MVRRLRPRGAARCSRRRVAVVCALSAGWTSLVACDPPASQSRQARRGAQSERAGFQTIHSSPADESALQTPQSARLAQPAVPLPPGWAAPVASAPGDRLVESSGANVMRPANGYQTASGRQSAGQDSYGQSERDRPTVAANRDDRSGLRGAGTARRPRGNYTVMAVVFAVPLVLSVPVVWLWHWLRTLHGGPRYGARVPWPRQAR
jgi:hypothetical protein